MKRRLFALAIPAGLAALAAPAAARPSVTIVDYDVVTAGFHHFNWTGKEPPKPVEEVKTQEPAQPTHVPISELIRVIYVSHDLLDAAQSSALVVYLPASRVTLEKRYDGLMRVGDRLKPPHEHIRLFAVHPYEGPDKPLRAEFAFDDETLAHETLVPMEFEPGAGKIVDLLPGQTIDVPVANLIPHTDKPYAPPTRSQVYGNRVLIGTEDLKEISENYSNIIANEMRTRRHRGPDGAYDGIEITDIKPGSAAERHGLKGGDVIKSINGHPVNSVSEAVSYVKNNAGMHQGTWEVVVENLGAQRTIYVDPP